MIETTNLSKINLTSQKQIKKPSTIDNKRNLSSKLNYKKQLKKDEYSLSQKQAQKTGITFHP